MINLSRMRYLHNRLPMAQFRVERARSKTARMTSSFSAMPHGNGKSDPTADGAILLDEARNALESIRRELAEMQNELIPLIEQLDDPLQRQVMRMYYIDGRRVLEISYALNYSEQWMHIILRRAEKNLKTLESL